jgi:nitrous-oxide reductase
VIRERGLSPEDVVAALRTYVPGGKYDEYVMFASGGHSGQVLVIGIPSMRLLKVIGVFTPEPWQGYGFGEKGTLEVLARASPGASPSSGATPTIRPSPRPKGNTTASSCSSTTRPTPAWQ